jgi:hypothetical protein
MLDVHAPHGAGHGWKDFLFHMAAIACGLLLALALEKGAEYLHERRVLTDARHALVASLEENRRVWEKNVTEAMRIRTALEVDLRIIRALRSHVASEGKLDYANDLYATRDGAWQSVQQNGSLALMPHDELSKQAWLYRMLRDQLDSQLSLISSMRIAAAWAASAPPEKLDTLELDALERRTVEAQGQLDAFALFLKIEERGLNDLAQANFKMRMEAIR